MTSHTFHFIRGIVWSAGGNLLGMIASLGTIAIAARLLSKEDLGAFFLILVIGQLTTTLGDFGLKNTAIKILSSLQGNSLNETSQFFITVTGAISFCSCLLVACTIPFLKQVWPYPEFTKLAWYALPISFLMANFQMATSALVGAKLFRPLSIITGGIEIFRAGASIIALMLGSGVAGLLWSMMISRIIGILCMWKLSSGQFGFKLRHQHSQDMFRFGGWLYGGSLLSLLAVRSADTILASQLGTATLAIYTAAMQLPGALQRIFESIRPVLLGFVSSTHTHESNHHFESLRILTGILAIGASFLMVNSEPFMNTLYSDAYSSGIIIMQALCVWKALAIINYFFSISLIGTGSAKKSFELMIPQVIISIGGILLVIRPYGTFGVVAVLILTAILGNIHGAWLLASRNQVMFWALISLVFKITIPLTFLLVAIIYFQFSFIEMVGIWATIIFSLFACDVLRFKDIQSTYNSVAKNFKPKMHPSGIPLPSSLGSQK